MAKQRINTIPPKRVQENARRALMVRAKLPQSKKAMKDEKGNDTTGVSTARKLIGGRPLSVDTLRTMRAWFARHDTPDERKNRRNDRTSKAWQSWEAWGGDAGRRWVESVMKRIERNEKD
jgi:hypothetical protein